METYIAFTGHRPEKLYGRDILNEGNMRIRTHMRELLILYSLQCPITVISGMALGIDQMIACEAIKIKQEGFPIKLIAAIPFEGQETIWSKNDRIRYQAILEHCDEIVIVDHLQKYYVPHMKSKLQLRNQYMVDRCDLLIGYWDGSPGGTANCIKYARKKEKNIKIFNPKEC